MMSRVKVWSVLACASVLAACGGGTGSGDGVGAPVVAPVASVFAGSLQSSGSSDGVGIAARFNAPAGVVQDADGNAFVADSGNHTVRRIAADGTVTTFAGAAGQSGSADGVGGIARFSSPRGLAMDVAGNLYLADNGNHTVRKISAGGVVTTVAGVAGQAGSTDGDGAVARLSAPIHVAVDTAGSLYVASATAVRKMTPDGTVSTLPIQPLARAVASPLDRSSFSGIAVDAAGDLYIADLTISTFAGDGTIRKFTSQGQPLPFGTAPDGVVRVPFLRDLAIDGGGNLYVTSNGAVSFTPGIGKTYRTILRVTPAGVVTTIAGAQDDLFARSLDGTVASARFSDPTWLSVGPTGRIVVTEPSANAVRLVTPQGFVTTLAGGNGAGFADGPAASARFNMPSGLAVAADGSLYVADSNNGVIRRINPAGAVTTIGPSLSGAHPVGVAVSRAGAVFAAFVDGRGNRTIDSLGPAGDMTFLDSTSANSSALAADATGNVLIESGGILAIAPDKTTRLLATGTNAAALAVDGSGTIFFASAARVGKLDEAGRVQVLAGSDGQPGDQDGSGLDARFRSITALTIDSAGKLYVADGKRIRRIAGDGTVSTVIDLANLDGVDPLTRSIPALTWSGGALYATIQNAVIRVSPVN